jgi:hypothetical protein
MQLASPRARARAPTVSFGNKTLVVALVIVFPVIGLEQWWHTTPVVLRTLPLYEAMHWVSDSLLALPLAVGAVWGADLLATRAGLGWSRSDLFTRACMIAVLFALLLVPGEALHQQADALTHTHAVLGYHPHTAYLAPAADGLDAITGQVLHALSDAFEGQVLGLPLALAALVLVRKRRST